MKKRIISVLLAMIVGCSLLSGCGGNEGKSNNDNGSDERVTLSIGIPQNSNVTSYEDNAFTKYIEDSLNIDLEFVFFSSSTSENTQQISLMVSGNQELPDVLLGFWEMSQSMTNDFGEDGYFIDLTEPLEKYAVNFWKQMDTLDEDMQDYIMKKGTNSVDGGFYSMPFVIERVQDDIGCMTYINKNWLDKLNLSIPTNIDELYTVLKAFATQDPNGNGEADEIPMVSAARGMYDITAYIINAYEYFDNINPYYVEGDKVVEAAATDEYRQALIYANKLCKEGLFSDLSFTITATNEFLSLITPADNIARVGIWAGHPAIMTDSASTILDQYVALPALGDATGKGGYQVVREPSIKFSSAMITKDCKNVEAAVKLLDFFYQDEAVSRMRHGEKGVDWLDQEGSNDYGEPSHIEIVNTNAFFKGNSTWGRNMTGILNSYNYLANAVAGTGRTAEVSRLGSETWQLVKNAKLPEKNVSYLLYTEDEENVKSEKEELYLSSILEQRALFITGDANPGDDAAWDAYLNTLKKQGGAELLKVKQDAYSRK